MKKYIILLILILILPGCSNKAMESSFIIPLEIENDTKEFKMYRSALGDVKFYDIKIPEDAVSWSIDLYQYEGSKSLGSTGSFDNFTITPKDNFENLGIGIINNKFVYSVNDSVGSTIIDTDFLKTTVISSTSFLQRKINNISLNEPIILLCSQATEKNSINSFHGDYLKNFELEEGSNYYLGTITFYDYDITKTK